MAVLITAIAIYFGNSEQGWVLQTTSDILMLRYPRVFTAFFAGAVLAIAGCVIQRVTANPMASPEVMGVSSGVALILVIGILAGWITSRTDQLLLGSLGALLALGFMWIVARRNGLTPSQLVLSGVALSALLDAVIRVLLASGTDHAKSILVWLSGSTYLATQFDVASLVVVTVLLLSILLLLHRWLDILLLGDISASALGMNNKQVRFFLLSIAAVLVALATLAVGPLSFIGLLVPQITKYYGQYTAKHQLIIASLMGGIIMVVADWLGRNILFPWQLPAGLLASLIGGAFFLVLLRKTP
jgi:iron complex transport system permease protein